MAAAASSFHLLACYPHQSFSESDNNSVDKIVVRLTPQSKELVKKNLKTLRVGDYEVEDVVVHDNADKETQQYFSNIYGRRVAFRMKGYVKTKTSGRRAPTCDVATSGFGSVRGMGDPIELPGFQVSMPCTAAGDSNKANSDTIAIGLPTRLTNNSYYQNFLKDVAAGVRDGDNYVSIRLGSHGTQPGMTVEAVHLPFDRQLVVDGYLCPSKYFDKETGLCTWDKDVDGEPHGAMSAGSDVLPNVKASESTTGTNKNESVNEQANKEEGESKCPICAYIEAGVCKEHFLNWQGCIDGLQKPKSKSESESDSKSVTEASTGTTDTTDSMNKDTGSEPMQTSGDVSLCFPATKKMMQCFLAHEYYDIMTASMQDSMQAAFGDHAPSSSSKTKTKTKGNSFSDESKGRGKANKGNDDHDDDGDDGIFPSSSAPITK